MKKTKIILIDDHALVRQALKTAINEEERFEIVAEGANGKEAIDQAIKHKPDIIALDINMPVMDGVEAAKKIREFNKQIKILLITMLEDNQYVFDALNADINGFVYKLSNLEILMKALQTLADGENYFDEKVTNILIQKHRKISTKSSPLTAREIDIVKSVCAGLTSREISDKLFISVHTVQKHRKNILQKLNLHNSAELVKYSVEQGII